MSNYETPMDDSTPTTSELFRMMYSNFEDFINAGNYDNAELYLGAFNKANNELNAIALTYYYYPYEPKGWIV